MPPIPLSRLLVSALVLALPALAPAQEAAVAAQAEAQAAEQSVPDAPAEPAEPPSGLVILPAEEVELDSYLWISRVLVVFADTPADPRFVKQMQEIESRPRDLVERDVVVVTDTDPKNRSPVRKELRPRGFALVLVDKDGVVKLRKPSPWATREIARSIDKTPLRRQEIRDRSGSAGQ